MKKIATILVLLFVMVQFAPAICTLCDVQTALFMVDEEKNPEKTDKNEVKDLKTFVAVCSGEQYYTQKIQTACNLAEKIHISPNLEKLNPPPDFI